MFIVMPICCRMIGCQHSTGCLVVCFPDMMSSLAKSKQIIGCALSGTFSQIQGLFRPYFGGNTPRKSVNSPPEIW